jgi:hypothetical protein
VLDVVQADAPRAEQRIRELQHFLGVVEALSRGEPGGASFLGRAQRATQSPIRLGNRSLACGLSLAQLRARDSSADSARPGSSGWEMLSPNR